MADNIAVTPGTGATIAADDISGVLYPRSKVSWGADGAAVDASAANPLPVVQTGTPALPTGAATDATLSTLSTTLADVFITGQGSQTALNQNVVLASAGTTATDTLNQRSIAITITPAAGTVTAGNITFEGSNDNTNFVALPLYDVSSPNNLPISTYALAATTTRYFAGPLLHRYFRARISTGVTGTTTGIQAFTILRTQPFAAPGAAQVVNQTAANLNVTASIAATQTLATVTTVGTVSTLSAITAGSNLIADVGLQARANATGAATVHQLFSAATTNATNVKASAGRLLGYQITNTSAAMKYVAFHNSASAPTAGASVYFKVGIPTLGTVQVALPVGIAFSTGIGYTVVGAAATADTTAVAANDVLMTLWYA